jgi:hypothetical protein
MKLKCDDGIVRDFQIAGEKWAAHGWTGEAYCKLCDEPFGFHDTYILKPLFKAHICKKPIDKPQ